LTGERSEATFFMFKSFLPKIVQIPASAIPLALLPLFGYLGPVGGRVQNQPASVALYMRIAILIGSIISLIAWAIKRRYPLDSQATTELGAALSLHSVGKEAKDPISGLYYIPQVPASMSEHKIFWLLDHFWYKELKHSFPLAMPGHSDQLLELEGGGGAYEELLTGADHIRRFCTKLLVVAIIVQLTTAAGVAGTLPLITHKTLQILPTLLVVSFGMAFAFLGFSVLRWRAAKQLEEQVEDVEDDDEKMLCMWQYVADLMERRKRFRTLGHHDPEPETSDEEDFSEEDTADQ